MPAQTTSETKESRRFALILAGIFIVLAILAGWKHHPARMRVFLAAAAAAPVLAYAALPVWVRFFRLWMRFAELFGWVMTRVILTLFYYLLLTPYGLIARTLREDPLDLSWKRRKQSYWIDKPPAPPERERYERQY